MFENKGWGKIIVLVVLLTLLAACGPTPTPEVIKETVVVTKEVQVEVTKEVPVEVTKVVEVTKEVPVEAETITVIFPRHEADIVGAFPRRILEFTAETGINVKLIQMGWDEVADKVVPEMAAGGDAYDIVEFDNGWVAEWCGAGWATPLDDYMPEGYTDGMVPGLVDLFTCPDGKVYGLVWNNDTRFFYYNAKMLEEAGIEAPPKTWDELVEQTKILQEKGIAEYGFIPFWKMEWALANEFHFWAYTFGGEIVDEKGCFLWNTDPKTLAALEFMVSVLEEGIADPAALTYDQEAAQDIFLKGDAAFFPQGWPGMMAYADNPEVSDVVGQVKVAMVPGAEEGMTAALTLPEAYAIPVGSKHKEAAWKFIEYMTSKETNKVLAKEIGTLPIWLDLYTDPDLVALYPHWADFSEQMATARGLSTLTWYGDFVEACIAETQTALAGKATAQEALDAMVDVLGDYECVP